MIDKGSELISEFGVMMTKQRCSYHVMEPASTAKGARTHCRGPERPRVQQSHSLPPSSCLHAARIWAIRHDSSRWREVSFSNLPSRFLLLAIR